MKSWSHKGDRVRFLQDGSKKTFTGPGTRIVPGIGLRVQGGYIIRGNWDIIDSPDDLSRGMFINSW